MKHAALFLAIIHFAYRQRPSDSISLDEKATPEQIRMLSHRNSVVFFTNTLAHFAASVAHAPSNSNAWEFELKITKTVQISMRVIQSDAADIPFSRVARQSKI